MDAFPGKDAGKISPGDGDASPRRECRARGCGGFVSWHGAAYLRSQPADELYVAASYALGSELWLPVSALRSRGSIAACSLTDYLLPAQSSEVVVPGARSVEKCRGLTEGQMNERFVRSKPVVLTDAQRGWSACKKWTLEWLAENFGNEELMCSDLAPFFRHCDSGGRMRTVKATMREYIRYIRCEPNAIKALQREPDRVFYANGWTPFLRHDGLLRDVSDRLYCVEDTIPRSDACREFNLNLLKVFIGPAGTVTRLHHDTFASHVWLSQIRGRKQFICYPPGDSEHLHCHLDEAVGGRTSLFDPSSPDYAAFPEARRATPFSVVVEEGETVVLPCKWWHWAKSLTPSITLMRNFVNSSNMAEHVRIRQHADQVRLQRPAPAKAPPRA